MAAIRTPRPAGPGAGPSGRHPIRPSGLAWTALAAVLLACTAPVAHARPAAAKTASAAAAAAPTASAAQAARKTKKSGKTRFIPGSEESPRERVQRLKRECKGRPNSGACLGHAS